MGISPFYVILLMIAGVLIFGKDLPDVMRKLGSALMEFRKGMSEVSSGVMRNSKVGNSKTGSSGGESGKFEVPVVDVSKSGDVSVDVNDDGVSFSSDNKFEPPV
ncbi:MAG: twin-arginine translocase TatA/TatE family subunit [Planctomycetaceae bacterium]|jgi:Sec-independent protein translocase protein TatA|nr:twin-arginine translocase TatA/TatE family subunit [Planctomycetaceae bacterium]